MREKREAMGDLSTGARIRMFRGWAWFHLCTGTLGVLVVAAVSVGGLVATVHQKEWVPALLFASFGALVGGALARATLTLYRHVRNSALETTPTALVYWDGKGDVHTIDWAEITELRVPGGLWPVAIDVRHQSDRGEEVVRLWGHEFWEDNSAQALVDMASERAGLSAVPVPWYLSCYTRARYERGRQPVRLSDADGARPSVVSDASERQRSAMDEAPSQPRLREGSSEYGVWSLLLSLAAIGACMLYARWHGQVMSVAASGAEGGWLSWGWVNKAHLAAKILAGLAFVCAAIAYEKRQTSLAVISLGVATVAVFVTWFVMI